MLPSTPFLLTRRRPIVASVDAATAAWVAQVVSNGGSVSAGRQTTVDALITGLKSDGIWTILDRLWIFAAENTQSALTDMVALTLATANGSPTFSADVGYTGTDNSTTVYIDSGFNPTSGTPNFAQNSNHSSMWSNTNATSAAGGAALGLLTGTNQLIQVFPKFNDGNTYFRTSDTGSTGVAVGNSQGHLLGNRDSGTTNQGYRNGVDQGFGARVSGTPSNGNVYILAQNTVGTGANSGDDHQNCAVSLGGSLTPTQVTNFYNRLRTYMTAVGVP